MSRILATLLLAAGLIAAPAARATTPHTIVVDGALTDFAADEKTTGDPSTDSDYGYNNELSTLYVTWDAAKLYLGFNYGAWGGAVIYLVDIGVSGGVTDLCPNKGYSGAFPANLQASTGLELMVALYAHPDGTTATKASVHTLGSKTSAEISTKAGVAVKLTEKVNAATSERNGVVEAAIPWSELYGLGAGKVPAGAKLRIAGALRGNNDGDGLGDLSPGAKGLPKPGSCWSSAANPLASFFEITVDADKDGAPDKGWSPGSNTSKVDAGVPPVDAGPDAIVPDTAAADATGADTGPPVDAVVLDAAVAEASTPDAGAQDLGPPVDADLDAGGGQGRQEEGCACSAKASSPSAAALALLVLVGLVRVNRGRRP